MPANLGTCDLDRLQAFLEAMSDEELTRLHKLLRPADDVPTDPVYLGYGTFEWLLGC